MSNWATGHNMPGYLPEADVYITSSWLAARNTLIEDLKRAADYDADDDTDAGTNSMAEYESAISDLRALAEGTEYDVRVGKTAWWLNATDESPDDDDDDDDDGARSPQT